MELMLKRKVIFGVIECLHVSPGNCNVLCQQLMLRCRQEVCEQEQLRAEEVELSMGMSHDFEHAVGRIIISVPYQTNCLSYI